MNERSHSTHENVFLIGLVLIGDLVISNLLYAFFCRFFDHLPLFDFVRQSMIVSSIVYLACTMPHGVVLYKRKVANHQIVMRVMQNVFMYAVAFSVVLYIGKFYHLRIFAMCIYWLSMLVAISVFRITVRHFVILYRSQEKHIHKVVLVGSSENNESIYGEMTETPTLGYKVLGYFDHEPNPNFPEKCAYLGKPDEVVAYLDEHPGIHELYCCLPSRQSDTILPIIHYCQKNFVHFYSMPNVNNYMHHRMYFNMLGNVPYLSFYNEPLALFENRVVKRLFDIAVSLTFLCTLFPIILIIVAIVTKATMPGPIFFRQKRTGLNGQDFYCLKFRSMKVNDDADTLQATKDDPRKTKWGDIMRKTNIDELPQFINVLLGQMSIVGPRPHMVKQTNDYSKIIDDYMVRHYVKPGITGWSQVTGYRGETKRLSQMEGRVRGDIWYLEHWSIWLDIYIMYKTVANAVAGDKNAY